MSVAVATRVRAAWPQITAAAKARGLPPHIVAGVVCQESAGIPGLGRFEKGYRWVHWESLENPPGDWKYVNRATRLNWQKSSWGPMQVMGAVALERGYQYLPAELCTWVFGLEVGCAHLAWLLELEDLTMNAALLRYNGGGDKIYHEKILRWAKEFEI